MDFSPDATPRYILKYNAAGLIHHIMVRGDRTNTLNEVQTMGTGFMHGLFDALKTILPADLSFISALLIDKDTNIGVPGNLPTAVTGTAALNTYSVLDKISHLTFSGKSSGGSKASIKVFAPALSPDSVANNDLSDFAFTAGEAAATIDAAVAFLGTQGNARAIDSTGITWYTRVTYKINDKWLRVARKGGLSHG